MEKLKIVLKWRKENSWQRAKQKETSYKRHTPEIIIMIFQSISYSYDYVSLVYMIHSL